jgi:hypothetical protein
LFCNEGFPYTVEYARQSWAKGFRGILGEFTMQHLSSGELEAYLKSKLFNGIVFFGIQMEKLERVRDTRPTDIDLTFTIIIGGSYVNTCQFTRRSESWTTEDCNCKDSTQSKRGI